MNLPDQEFHFKPIGWVQSCYPDKFGTPRQSGLVASATGKIHIHSSYQPQESLRGLAEFSHLWVLFAFHQSQSARFHASVHPPRLQGASLGVFATRSPHRPNPIGMSLYKIIAVESDGIRVSGLDVVDGTPVLDIKPYLPAIESVPGATSGWSDKVLDLAKQIEWSDSAIQILSEWQTQLSDVDLRSLIESTLRLDPRPIVYRGYEGKGEDSPYRNQHAVRIHNGDVKFEFLSDSKILVSHIEVSQ